MVIVTAIRAVLYLLWSAVIAAWEFCTVSDDVECMICNGRCLKNRDMDDPDSRIVEPPDIF